MPQRTRDNSNSNSQSGRNLDELEIREMELEDLPHVFTMGEQLFTADRWPSLYRTWDEYELVNLFASDGEYCMVAEINEEVVGFILGTLIEKRNSAWKYGYLLWLGVVPELRRSGIARKLLHRLTDEFIENGARMMLVDTDADNEEAMRFFEKEGYGKAVRHVYMSRNLTTLPSYQRRRKE